MELDQIRQVKFAPTAAEVLAANNTLTSRQLAYYDVEHGFNVDSYNLDGTVSSLDDLANYITGVDATEKTIQLSLDNYKANPEAPVGVNVLSVLNVESSGMYTLAIRNDEPFRLMLNGTSV